MACFCVDASVATAQSDAGQAVDDLSKEDYSVRQNATIQMWKDHEGSREVVQQAARNPDPEISGRAQWILRQWRRGALPDMPPEVSRLLQGSDQPAAVERLLEAGQFLAAVVAVEESAGTVDRESIQRRVNASLNRRFPIYIHQAMQSESLPHLLNLLDLVADSAETAACRLEMMRLMSIPITDDNRLPASAANWPIGLRDSVSVMLLVKLGQYDEAVAAARSSGDESLLTTCMMVASKWREIADAESELAQKEKIGSAEHSLHWCRTLAAADRAGDPILFDEAVKQIVAPEACELPMVIDMRWKSLASHGRTAQALSILDGHSPEDAASLSMDASDFKHALDVMGYPIDRIDIDYVDWIANALKSQHDAGQQRLAPEMRRLLVLMQCLISVGRDDTAWVIAKQLCESDQRIGVQTQHRLREYVLTSLTTTKRTDWIPVLAVDPSDRSVSPDSLEITAGVLPDADGTTIEIVMDSLERIDPTSTVDQRFLEACQLLEGIVPQGFDAQVDFDKFFDSVTRPLSTTAMRGLRGRGIPIQANLNIALMFSRLGQTQHASGCLRKLAESGDTAALFRMGEQALDSGRTEIASQLFDLVYRKIQSQSRIGGIDDVALALKAVVGKWTIARRSGDKEAAAQLEHELQLALCTPYSQTRNTLASYLTEREENDLAIQTYRSLLPIKIFGSNDSIDFYSVARGFALAARDAFPDESARWFDLAVLRSIESDGFRAGAFVTLPVYVCRWAIEAAVASGNHDVAAKQIDRLLSLDPLDIDLAERLLPTMREAGMTDLADQTLDRVMDRGIEYSKNFPMDAMMANNLAWVAAMNKRRLSEARELSEAAVRVEPDSAIYRDTLAEILFLVGEKDQALKIETGCLLDDPGQWHLHEQVKRFSVR
ncbi:tetratricopeptide repeat protein [Rubripirellula tenax]|nr:hypothetical protein [Rubripirellula tenax]